MAQHNADLNVVGTLTVPSGIFSDSVTLSGAPVLTTDSALGGGSALTVKTTDNNPSVSNVDTIVVTAGTLADDGGGQVTLDTGGSGGGAGSGTASGIIGKNLSSAHSPAGLWHFDQSLADASGNALTLTVVNGEESYSNVNGIQGFKFTGNDTLGYGTSGSALEITGDVTIEVLFSSDDLSTEREIVSYANQTLDTEATNFLYGLRVRAGGGLRYDAEFGAGSNVTYTIDDGPSLGTLNHITLVRESADVTFYLNGYKIGASSSGLTAPTGGTSAFLNIGLQDGFGDELEGVICGLKIIPSALTASQVFDEYQSTWIDSGSGSSLVVEEQDGSPTVSGVSKIKVTNGTLTDEGSGVISIDTGGSGGGGGGLGQVSVTGTVWNPFLAPSTASGTPYNDEFLEGVAVTGTLAQGDWTLWDPGSSALDVDTFSQGGGLRMRKTNTSDSIEFMGIYKPIPTESLWEAVTYVHFGAPSTLAGADTMHVGFAFFDDAAGNPSTTDFVFQGIVSNSTGFNLYRGLFDSYTDDSPASTSIDTDSGDLGYNGVFLRSTARDGTNTSFDLSYSFDGFGWKSFSFYTFPFTVNEVGIVCSNALTSSLMYFGARFFRIDPHFGGIGRRGFPVLGNYMDPTGGGGGVADPLTIGTINVTDSLTISGVPVPLEGGGGGSTTASGGYFEPMAPPTYPSPFDDEFDSFTDDAESSLFLDDPDPVWTQWDPGGNIRMRNQYGEGVDESGFGFSSVGNATPTWQGYIRPIEDMAATVSGGQSYWFDVHVSMAERQNVRGLGGILLGGDLVGSPTTEKFIYIALENNAALAAEDESQSQVRWVTNGVDYNDAITTNSSTTDASGPNFTGMHLRLMYDGLNDRYAVLYSTDGFAFSSAEPSAIVSGTLNFTPEYVGLIGRGEDSTGGWTTRFSHFRFRKGNDRDIEGGSITHSRIAVNGARVYSVPAAGSGGSSFDPSSDQTITGEWDFNNSLTVSGVPVNIGPGGGSGTITDINTVATGPSVTITGAGGVNTITDGNVITISGAGNFSPGFRGALVTTTSGMSVDSGAVLEVPWDSTIYDTDGFSSVRDSRFVIPPGIKKVRFSAAIFWDDDDATADGSERLLQIVSFPSVDAPAATTIVTAIQLPGVTSGSTEPTANLIHSPAVDVVPGTAYGVRVRQLTGSTISLTTSPTSLLNHFGIEVVDPAPVPGPNLTGKLAFRGARVTTTSGIDTSNLVAVTHPWDEVVYDTDGFTNSGDVSTFIIPAGVTRVRLRTTVQWSSNSTGYRRHQFRVGPVNAGSGGSLVYAQASQAAPSASHAETIISPIFDVSAGEEYSVLIQQGSGGALSTSPASPRTRYFFEIEVIEDNEPITFNEFAAVSGTFSQSLTISGVPVSTGTGGGGSANTLQDAYDNGDGVITTTAGKPLHIDAEEYDGNVDFQVTGSGKFSEALQVGSGTVFIDGDKIQTPALFVDGSAVTAASAVQGFSGAAIKLNTTQAVPNLTNYIVEWNESLYDTDGYVDLVSDDTVLTIPEGAGVTRVNLLVQIVWDNSTSLGRRVLQFQKNGGSLMDGKLVRTDGGVTAGNHKTSQTMALGVSASPGDTFEVLLFQSSGGNLDISDATAGSSSWFSIERADSIAVSGTNFTSISGTFTDSLTVSGVPVNIGEGVAAAITDINAQAGPSITITGTGNVFTTTEGNAITIDGSFEVANNTTGDASYAVIDRLTDQSIAHLTLTAGSWDNVVVDTDSYYSGAQPTRLTVPSGLGIRTVEVGGQIQWDKPSTDGMLMLTLYMNGGGLPSDATVKVDSIQAVTQTTVTQIQSVPVQVQAGDYFELNVITSLATPQSLDFTGGAGGRSHFWIKDVTPRYPLEVIAASGTYSESLTISGVPVSTGTGGGAGTISDINTVATGPSVTITGVAGINTITEGNTITVSGSGKFSPGFRGAFVTVTSGVSVPDNVAMSLGMNDVRYDTNGFYNSSEDYKLTIPAGQGIKKVQLFGATRWNDDSPDADGTSRLTFIFHWGENNAVKNYFSVVGGPGVATGELELTGQAVHTPTVDVEDGDYFSLAVRQRTGSNLSLSNSLSGDNFLSLEVKDPAPVPGFVGKEAFNGALMRKNANQTVTTAVQAEATWETVIHDSNNWIDLTNNRFVVPEGVTKVQLSCNILWANNTVGRRGIQTVINGASRPGIIFYSVDATGNTGGSFTAYTQTSGPIEVSPGDFITLRLDQDSGGNLDVVNANSTWFGVEAIETDESFQIDEFTAVSGTFNQSLTVSGVPVLTAEDLGVLPGDFSGATVTTTSGVSIPNTTTVSMPWDRVDLDVGGWRTGAADELVVPAGVTHVQVTMGIRWTGNVSGYRTLHVRKNGTSIGQLKEDALTSAASTFFHQVISPPTAVSEGDVLTGDVYQNTGITIDVLSETVPNTRCFLSAVALNAGVPEEITAASGTFNQSLTVSGSPVLNVESVPLNPAQFVGALLTTSSGISIPNGVDTPINWDTVNYDFGGLVDLGTYDRGFVIPAQYENSFWVIKSNVRFATISTAQAVYIQNDYLIAANGYGLQRVADVSTANEPHSMLLVSHPFHAPAGTELKIDVRHGAAPSWEVDDFFNNTWFSIERVGVSGTV